MKTDSQKLLEKLIKLGATSVTINSNGDITAQFGRRETAPAVPRFVNPYPIFPNPDPGPLGPSLPTPWITWTSDKITCPSE